mmetsp:Transcript_31054/g.58228  ORF Transcript_31054/g.58228 Transcript_31054/m.58228 type:complete len:110 (-) Transcript_31054:7-336(-)
MAMQTFGPVVATLALPEPSTGLAKPSPVLKGPPGWKHLDIFVDRSLTALSALSHGITLAMGFAKIFLGGDCNQIRNPDLQRSWAVGRESHSQQGQKPCLHCLTWATKAS